jgi:IS30 family transposase
VKPLALSRDDIDEIRVLCQTHMQRDVAALLRVAPSTVSRALRGITWRADGALDPHRANAKLTVEAVQEIRSSALSRTALARKFGVCSRTIHRAVRRETWGSVEQ